MAKRKEITSSYYRNQVECIASHTRNHYVNSDVNFGRIEIDTECEFIDTPKEYDGPMHEGLPLIEDNGYRYQSVTNVPLMPGTKVYQRNLSTNSLGASGVYRLSVVTGLRERVLTGMRINEAGEYLQPYCWVYETRTITKNGKLGKVFSESIQHGWHKMDVEACKKKSEHRWLYATPSRSCAKALTHGDIDLDYLDSGISPIRPRNYAPGCKTRLKNAVKANDLQWSVQKEIIKQDFFMKRFEQSNPEAFKAAKKEWFDEISNQSYNSSRDKSRKAIVANYVEKVRDNREGK